MKISMCIFDLDGTIISNHRQYVQAFKNVLKNLTPKNLDDVELQGSIGIKENWPILINKYQIITDKTWDELAVKTQEEYLKLLDQVHVRAGFVEFVEDLKARGIEIALATSNTWEVVDQVLERFQLTELFDIVTTHEEAIHTKPAPDLFLITARKSDIEPSNCLVFEDALAGIQAAHEAKMKVVAIADDYNEKTVEDADLIFSSYNDIKFNQLEEL